MIGSQCARIISFDFYLASQPFSHGLLAMERVAIHHYPITNFDDAHLHDFPIGHHYLVGSASSNSCFHTPTFWP